MKIYEIDFKNKKKEDVNLSKYQGNLILVINTASNCGFTSQFTGLEQLNQEYKDQGLTIIGFPTNDFKQEKKGDEIYEFCQMNYGVTFEMMDLIHVNGSNTAPIYKYLKSKKRGLFFTKRIKWNFTKFLIDQQGNIVKRYPSYVKPKKIKKDIDKLIQQNND